MGNEGDVATTGKKKRKNSVVNDLGVDSNVQVADKDPSRKKKKSKVLDDMTEGGPELNTGVDMNETSRKGKKKKDRSQEIASAQGDDNKGEGKIKRSESGDKRGSSYALKASSDEVNEYSDHQKKDGVSKADAAIADEIGLVKGAVERAREEEHQKKKEKKKKKKKETELNSKKKLSDDVRDSGFAENHLPNEISETVQPVKKKKQKKVNEFAGSSNFVGDKSSIENSTDHDITGKVDSVKVFKQKKKKDRDVLGATFSRENPLADDHANVISTGEDSGVSSSKRNETSSTSKEKGDANAGTSKTVDINESSFTDFDEITKEKKRKKKRKDASVASSLDEGLGSTTCGAPVSESEEHKDKGSKKRKEKSIGVNNSAANVDMSENNEKNEVAEPSGNLEHSKKSKKVKFSENLEVFPLHDSSSKGKKKHLKDGSKGKKKQLNDGSKVKKKQPKDGSKGKKKQPNVNEGLIQGKRFSKEEDEIIRDAVFKYIEDHQLGENGVAMVMKCGSHPEIRNCWKEIGQAVPYRPIAAVYNRAHILFERSETHIWTPEDMELVKKFYEKHGPDWRTLADELGRHRFHVKDAWRRIRFANHKYGNWSQEEYQQLFDLVNMDLSMKVHSEKKVKHGMLRDNISWEAISDKLSTRSNSICCMKWYRSLMSPMVAEGVWANTDDYRLLIALGDLDAFCEEDVDWDNLLEHRSGDVCHKRWNQMVRHIGEYGTNSFSEQVDVLSQRYCPDILEARECYDNKTPVD